MVNRSSLGSIQTQDAHGEENRSEPEQTVCSDPPRRSRESIHASPSGQKERYSALAYGIERAGVTLPVDIFIGQSRSIP